MEGFLKLKCKKNVHAYMFSSLCVALSRPQASGDIKKHLRGLAVTVFVKEQTVRGLPHTLTLLTLSNLQAVVTQCDLL